MYQEKYILLGKFAPNDWRPIGAIYDELRGMSFTYDSYEEANMALRDLKNLGGFKYEAQHGLTRHETPRAGS